MNFLRSKFLSIGLLVLAGWLFIQFVHIKSAEKTASEDVINAHKKADDIAKQNKNAERTIELSQNPSYLEKEVRLKLNYKAPDEEVALVYRSETSSKSAEAKVASGSNGFSHYLSLILDFFGRPIKK